MTKEKKLNYIEDLLKCSLGHSNDASLGPLFDTAKNFLEKRHKVKDLFIFSAQLDALENTDSKALKWIRTLLGREKLPKYAHLSDELLILLNNKDQRPQQPTIIKLGQSDYYYIPFGRFEGQYIFAVAFTDCMDEPVHPYFSKFLQAELKEISRWREASKFESLIYIDDVTQLFNQRKLVKDIDAAIQRYSERGETFAVLFIDIDHFKLVNDSYGHLVGTQLLADVAGVLRGLLRDSDLCYRYGGDEFVLLIPDANINSARIIGERILKTVVNHVFKIDEDLLINKPKATTTKRKHDFKLSVSVGVSCFPHDARSSKEILDIADRMMYHAKKTGRGRVCFTGDLLLGEA